MDTVRTSNWLRTVLEFYFIPSLGVYRVHCIEIFSFTIDDVQNFHPSYNTTFVRIRIIVENGFSTHWSQNNDRWVVAQDCDDERQYLRTRPFDSPDHDKYALFSRDDKLRPQCVAMPDKRRPPHTCAGSLKGNCVPKYVRGFCGVVADCSGPREWNDVTPLKGFWRLRASKKSRRPYNSTNIYACVQKSPACLGSGSEASALIANGLKMATRRGRAQAEGCDSDLGYRGKLCHQCKDGYARSGSVCISCKLSFGVDTNVRDSSTGAQRNTVMLLIAFVIFIIVCSYICVPKKRQSFCEPIERFSAMKSYFQSADKFLQVICAIGGSYSIEVPRAILDFLSAFDFINLDIVSIFKVGCIQPLSFFNKLLLMYLSVASRSRRNVCLLSSEEEKEE